MWLSIWSIVADESLISPEELEVRLGPEGPVPTAIRWFEHVLRRDDLSAAWPLTDPQLRCYWVQWTLWILRERLQGWDLKEVANGLVVDAPTHPYWPRFAHLQSAWLQEQLGRLNIERDYAIAGRPRLIPPAYEVIDFVLDPDDVRQSLEQGLPVEMLTVLMHSTPQGWRLLNFAQELPIPGWPPNTENLY
jgi:hypothetical protein